MLELKNIKKVYQTGNFRQEALKDILIQAQTNQNTIKPSQEKTEDTKEKKNTNINFWIIAIAGQIIFLLVGLIIGITI